jgi:hypothetical protein
MASLPERTPVKVDEFRNNFRLHRSILHKNVVEFGTDLRRIRIKREIVESFMPLIHEIVNKSIPKGDKKLPAYDANKLKVEDDAFGGFDLQYEKLPRLAVGPTASIPRSPQETDEAKDYPVWVNILYKPLPAVPAKLQGAEKEVAEAKRTAREKLFTTNAEPIADAIVKKIKSFPPPVQKRVTPVATTAVPNAIQTAESEYNEFTVYWDKTPLKNKQLLKSFGIEVTDNTDISRVELGRKQGEPILTADHFTRPLPKGAYARFFAIMYLDVVGGNHAVSGLITNTHVVVLHHYIQREYTALEEPFRKFVETTGKTYVVHPPTDNYNIQVADLRIQEYGACQRWYVMLPYTIAKYIAGGKPLADQAPEQLAKTAENWTKIGDWEFVKPVYESISKSPLKCWGDIAFENKLVGMGRTRRQRKRRSTRRR